MGLTHLPHSHVEESILRLWEQLACEMSDQARSPVEHEEKLLEEWGTDHGWRVQETPEEPTHSEQI